MTSEQEFQEILRDFGQYKQVMLEAIERFNETTVAGRFPIKEIKEKLEQEIFELVVVGQFKRGKTYLINALLGYELLPTGVVPLTSIVTVINYGETISASVIFANGDVRQISIEEVGNYVTEVGNPKNEKNVREVWVTFPSGYLKGGVRLVDTPGVGSIYRHNTDVAYRYLPRSDAAIFVLSVDQPAGQAEIDFLKDVKNFARKIFFVLNKIDVISSDEVTQAADFTRQVLEEVMGGDVKLFPLSAKWALEGRKTGQVELLESSRLNIFTSALEQFLMAEKGRVLMTSAAHRMLWYLSEAALSLELERKALISPVEELRKKIDVFETKRAELSARMSYFSSVVNHGVNRTILSKLDEDLRIFKDSFLGSMKAELLKLASELKDYPLDELNRVLKERVTDGLYENYMSWYEREKEALTGTLNDVFEPIRREIEMEVAELMKFSSDLFDLPAFPGHFSVNPSVKMGSVFRVKEEPAGLEIIDSVLTEKVPGWARRFARLKAFLEIKARERIVKKWLGQLERMSDLYAGRIRFAIIRMVEEAVESFRREMIEGMSRTIESLSSAISKGMALKERGELEAKERIHVIDSELRLVNDLRNELGRLYERISFSS
ncbi:MAG: dynamin family protein [Thermodesulforhabdaceae bacterium]